MKILQLTNYPTVNPMHGGQIRSSQIAGCLRAAGHEVTSAAVFLSDDFHEWGPLDIPMRKNEADFPLHLAFLSDFLITRALRENAVVTKQIHGVMETFGPDVILVEQPWLFEMALGLASSSHKLIYSSQNIEWRLKKDFLEKTRRGLEWIDEIKALEAGAVHDSDLVVACTEADAHDLAELSVEKKGEVIICGNGVSPFVCDESDVERWSDYFEEHIGSPFPVFVSSGHPPNASGFWSMLAPGLTFLRPEEDVLVIGGVCDLLTNVSGIKPFRDLNLSRLHLAGRQSLRDLQAMVRASQVVLLPIATGEGSNLKTAEALESGCWIVGTTKAFRGFENAISLPHVQVADTPGDFRRAVRSALDRPRNHFETPEEIRSSNYWQHKLAPLVAAVGNL